MIPLPSAMRRSVRTAMLALAVGLSGQALADDRIIFSNRSGSPARVVILSDDGDYRGRRFVPPGETTRLINGKGKTRLVINGMTFRVRDIGSRGDDAWYIRWHGGGAPWGPPRRW